MNEIESVRHNLNIYTLLELKALANMVLEEWLRRITNFKGYESIKKEV